jgi:flagellar motility protein MotE (MotC chaperone)
MTKPASRDIRILPAVIGVAAMLLALKAGGLAFTARAAQTAAAPAAASAAAPARDPAAAIKAALPVQNSDAQEHPSAAPASSLPPELAGSGVTPAQMDVLTSLSERRDALDARQRELDLQSNLLAASEKRVDQKIAELKSLQAKIEALLDQRDGQDAAQLDSLVRVYTAMKPKDAARIFERLDGDVRISVAGKMTPDVVAGILANLPADIAQRLTVELANRYKLPANARQRPQGNAPAGAEAPAPQAAANAGG